MAKNTTVILAVFCIILWVNCSYVRANSRQVIRQIYTAEIGVEEVGNNAGKRVEEYQRSAGIPKGSPWCAAFVTWCYQQAGIKAVRSGYVPDWFRKNVIYVTGGNNNQKPRTGDVGSIYFANLKRDAHILFIDIWTENGAFTTTVEGNTNDNGSREGKYTMKKRRLKRQIHRVANYIDYKK